MIYSTVGYKTKRVFELSHDVMWHETLIDLFTWLTDDYITTVNWGPLVLTSTYRPGDPRCHGTNPLRAVDLRQHSRAVGVAAADYINYHWDYDARRPRLKCALYHDVGNGPHLHIQVHPSTVMARHQKG
jgi:hypothetical protein